MLWQPSLDDYYTRMPADEAAERIAERRRELGEALVILGHHYQTDEVVRHADFTGDSLKLSQLAAKVARDRPVKHVVFCGVHFMAETADMLTPESVAVILPDLSAGCSMADMADYDDTVDAWNAIHGALTQQGWSGRIVPITYVNSTAAIKAFVGAHGGACCTSSNAASVFRWAMAGGTEPDRGDDVKILFLPDQHLGRNTAAAHGIDVGTESCVYDPKRTQRGEPLGGATAEQVLASKVILWAGHCSVHKLFRPEHCRQIRAENLDRTRQGLEPVQIIVHPECAKEVVDLADDSGSTEYILDKVRRSEPGAHWAVGTEVHLVNRLAEEVAPRGIHVRMLSDCQCLCTTMYRIDQPHLLWILDHLCGQPVKDGEIRPAEPKAVNVIRVHHEVRAPALLALERMLSLSQPMTPAPAHLD
ncbi:MAG: quinolinate synthase NadA [Phycisphaerales bacterium]|nr:quinolinate synthase NadA [Phycisphaerales bacterium]